ncbi:MAG: 16S rRNA (adenine(1518)-N(6)/adenine(1519)-N(6))-dimethyltransferase RsmA [Bacteroidales bacterium]|jgi:16S rRNA (adenine1518-N6/adenine1519-N6)-dimethyltransferase|nr:16S rRNA (adenine(1518)-N(6)/adenine(1519)-N(6))-dimethyltransferase RsmA [Bacteroidales bacterium]
MNNDKVTPKKRLGQHFLKDERIAKRVVESINSSNKNVLEIGPGMGILTKYLIENKTINLSVIEIDKESVSYLQRHFPELASRILAQNFLTLDLEAHYQEPVTIIGNFPYNISSQILFKLLDYKNLSTQLVGMFQKEVADRIASKPGSKQYGILSVLIQAFFDVEYLFTVESNLFFPPPKVQSAVIRITRNFEKKLRCDETLFKNVVKTAFNQRRKTLRNSLKSFTFEEKYLADPIFNKRPEQLSVEEFELITCWI